MGKKTVERATGAVVTTNATQTTLLGYQLPVGSAGLVEIMVVGRNTATGASALFNQVIGVKCTAAGVATLVGTTVSLATLKDTALNSAAVSVTVSGAQLLVRVTGLAGVTIDWLCEARITLN